MITAAIKYRKNIIILLLLFMAFVSLFQGIKNAASYSQDFQWDAAKVLFKGMNPYDESIEPSKELLALGYDEYYKQMEANQFPSLLMLLYPYTLLEPLMARYAWIASNIIFTLLVCILLRKTFFKLLEMQDVIILSLLMIASTPWRNQIGVGQHTIFSFMFFLLAVYLADIYEKKKAANNSWWLIIASGLALGISYFKYTLTAPLALYFVYKRRWKELIISVCPHAIMTMAAAGMVNDSLPNMLLKPLKVAAVLSNEGSMDFGSVLMAGNMTMLIAAVLMLFLFIYVLKMPPGMDNAVISVLLMWSLVMIYHRSYDFFVMILPFSCLLSVKKEENSRILTILYILLTIFIFFVLRIFNDARGAIVFAAVMYYAYMIYFTIITMRVIKSPVRSSNE